MQFKAIEDETEIEATLGVLRNKFAEGAEEFDYEGVAHWHQTLGIAGYISLRHDKSKWWNAFSDTRASFPKNLVVQLNSPRMGRNTGIMGVLATDPDGNRWILHQGRLRVSMPVDGKSKPVLLLKDMFDAVAGLKRFPVMFADGRSGPYIRIANIDSPAEVLQQDIAAYVHTCRKVKTFYEEGPDWAALDDKVVLLEGNETTEVPGQRNCAARPSGMSEKAHAEVWDALTKAVDKLGVLRRNRRISRLGYDLLTRGDNPALFEIKTGVGAGNVQQALGQLLIYESLIENLPKKILKRPAQKVLLVPDDKEVSSVLRPILKTYGIKIMTYGLKGKRVLIDEVALAKLIAPKVKLKAV